MKTKINLILVFAGLLVVLYISATNLKTFLNSFITVLQLRNQSYDDKMRSSWSSVVTVTQLIKDHIGEQGSVMYPPQSEDAWMGNGAVIQYFLFPLKLYSEDSDLIEKGVIDGVIVSSNWPNFFIPFQKIYFSPFRTYATISSIYLSAQDTKTELLSLQDSPKLVRKNHIESTAINGHSLDSNLTKRLERLDLTISESGSDFWLYSTNISILPDSSLSSEVKLGREKLAALIAEVSFSDGSKIYLSSKRNKYKDELEELVINNIYGKVNKLSSDFGYKGSYYISAIGLDIGVTPAGPFNDGVGLMHYANEKPITDSNHHFFYTQAMLLYQAKKYQEALNIIDKGLIVTDENSVLNYLKAKILMSQNDYINAENFLQKNIEENQDLNSAIELANITNENSFSKNSTLINSIYDRYENNVYLNLALGELYERLGYKIVAYRHYIKATKNYAYSAASVKAAHRLNLLKKDWSNNLNNEDFAAAYLNENFSHSAKILAKELFDNPNNEILSYSLKNAYTIKRVTFDELDVFKNLKTKSGVMGEGLSILENKGNSSNNFISLAPLVFPVKERGLREGTIEFFWQTKEANLLNNNQKKYFLLDQVGSLGKFQQTMRLFIHDSCFVLQIKQLDSIIPYNLELKSDRTILEEGRWNLITISWGNGYIRLYRDKILLAEEKFQGKIGVDPNIYFGLAPDRSDGSSYNPEDFSIPGIVDDIEISAYSKHYENGIEIWP